MLSALAVLLVVSQPAQPPKAGVPGRPAWVLATVGQSEWCPAGNVRLDLRTGRYALTVKAPRLDCGKASLERPVKMGSLDSGRLEAIRKASSRAAVAGLEAPACRNGGRPETIVVSNGGTQILVLATGAAIASAPDELGCWSNAATALHRLLDETFARSGGR